MMDNVLLGDSIPASGVGSGPFDLIFIFFLLVELDCVTRMRRTDWATNFNVYVD